jgi:drug/metabolite transporter (DMT)-like permease
MGVLNNVIPFSLMAWGQLYIPSGLTSIFNASIAIFGVLVAALLLADERMTQRRALGVAIGFGCVVTAIGTDSLRQFDITSLAQLAVLSGTLSYAHMHLRGSGRANGWAASHPKSLPRACSPPRP